jgi:hypothetical protein
MRIKNLLKVYFKKTSVLSPTVQKKVGLSMDFLTAPTFFLQCTTCRALSHGTPIKRGSALHI